MKRLEKLDLKKDLLPDNITYTKIVCDEKESVEKKLKQLRGSFFGRPLVKFDIGEIKKVWIPYTYVKYDFLVEKTGFFNPIRKNNGTVAIVFDINEFHGFQYDYHESGDLVFNKLSKEMLDGEILKHSHSDKAIFKEVEDHIQYRVMSKLYGRKANLELIMSKKFYRPAMQIKVIYKESNENIRYAYLDKFGVENEHVSGLRYRVNNM